MDTMINIITDQIDKFFIMILNLLFSCKKTGKTRIKIPIKYTSDINLFVNNLNVLKIILI